MPALAVATSVAGERRQFQLGCDEDARFRIASITKPMTASLAVQLLDLDESTGIWPEEVRVRHLLSHVTGYDGEIGDLARFGDGDDALGAAVAELPSVERLVPLDAAWSYANTGYWLAGWLGRAAERLDLRGSAAGARARPGRPRRGDVRLAEPRRHRPRAEAAATIRAPAALRAGSSRPPREVGRFADWQLRQPWTNALRVPLAKPPGGVYGLGFFGERVGGDRRLGPPRLLRRLPVHAPARAEPRRLARRADEQQPRQPGAARRRGRLVRGAARRPAPRRTDGRARAGGARPARRHLRERGHDGDGDAAAAKACSCRRTTSRRPRGRSGRRRSRSSAAMPTATASTSRSTVSRASAAGSPAASRDRRGRRRPSGHRRGRRRDPRRGRQCRRRRRRGVTRVVRRGDRDDGAARRRPRDLPRRVDRCGAQPRLLRRRAVRRRCADDAARGAVRRGARALRGRRIFVRGARPARPGSPSCGAPTADCRGGRSSSRRCGSRERASRCRRRTRSCLAMLEPVMTMREGARLYAPGGTLLADGRPARPAGSRGGARADPRRGREHRLLGLDRGGAARARRRAHGTLTGDRPRALPGRVVGTRRGAFAGRRVLTRSWARGRRRDAQPLRSGRRPVGAARGAGRRRTRWRPHDEPDRRRRRRERVRAHDQPRARVRRLAAGARPAPEQHARRDRPRPGRARAGDADGEHDGPDVRLRRRRPRARARRGRRHAAADGARRRARERPHGGLEVQDAIDRPRFHPAGDVVNAEPGVDETWLQQLESRGRPCAAGRAATTTSAGSAPSGARARAQIRGGAGSRCGFRRNRRRDPAEVAAARAAGVLVHGAPVGGLAVARAAVEAADALDVDDVAGGGHVTERRRKRLSFLRSTRPGRRARLLDVAGDLRDQVGFALERPLVAQLPPELETSRSP